MQHVAIMKKSWGLLPKIIDGRKTIESRWLMNRSAPWGKVRRGDIVYFKNSSEPVVARAIVSDVLQFEALTLKRVAEILDLYGEDDGITSVELPEYEKLFSKKKYCVLVFLEDVEPVTPFDVDKRGYGALSAWITTPSVQGIRR